MNRLLARTLALACIASVALVSGCKKKATEEQPATTDQAAAPAAPPSESQEVWAAIDKKDYETAIALLIKAKNAATTKEQEDAANNLMEEAKIKLLELRPTDPKADEALANLRRLTGGR